MICNKCKSEMVDDCSVTSYYNAGVVIKKKSKWLFNKAKSEVKACVCTNCGSVEFYIDNYAEFAD